MQVDSNPLQIEDAYFSEPVEVLMVKDTDGFDIEVK